MDVWSVKLCDCYSTSYVCYTGYDLTGLYLAIWDTGYNDLKTRSSNFSSGVRWFENAQQGSSPWIIPLAKREWWEILMRSLWNCMPADYLQCIKILLVCSLENQNSISFVYPHQSQLRNLNLPNYSFKLYSVFLEWKTKTEKHLVQNTLIVFSTLHRNTHNFLECKSQNIVNICSNDCSLRFENRYSLSASSHLLFVISKKVKAYFFSLLG